MKVLVTGAAGFFGSNLCEYLLSQNCRVVGVDNFNDYYSPKIKEYNLKEFKDNKNLTLYRDDILDFPAMEKIFNNEGLFHTIIHLAAWAGVTTSITKPNIYVRNNIEGTVNMAELAVRNKVKNFVFASTSSIYGTNPVPYKEDMKIKDPQAPYPATKRAAELLLKTYSINFDLSVTVMRIFNPQGKRMRPDLALPKLIRSCEYGDVFPVFWAERDLNKTSRDYCYIGHMLNAIDEMIKSPFEFEIFNLGNSSPVTLGGLFEAVEEVTGKKLNLRFKPERKGEMISTYADIKKAGKMLNYNPTTSIKESVEIFYKWYLDQENWYKRGLI